MNRNYRINILESEYLEMFQARHFSLVPIRLAHSYPVEFFALQFLKSQFMKSFIAEEQSSKLALSLYPRFMTRTF